MKIAFIAAIPMDRLAGDHSIAETMSLPLGPLYVASSLQSIEKDHEIRFFNPGGEMRAFGPDVVAVSAVSQNFNEAIRIAHNVKQWGDVVTVIGGPHITALPETLPKSFDYGVVGEGEKTFIELIRYLKKRGQSHSFKPENINGLVYHEGDKNVINPAREEVSPMDVLSFPDRHTWAARLGVAHIMTSRGCPFHCSFCSEPVLWKKYRTHSVDYVIREIRDIQRHFNPPHLLIADDLFIVDKKRLITMAERFEATGLNQEMAFSAWGRVNLVDEDMIDILRRMNLIYMAFGIESGSESVLKHLKPGVSTAMDQRAIDLCYDAGIKVGCTFIIASPEETTEDLERTYKFIKRNMNKMTGIEINPCIPLPGTPLWEWAFRKKLVSLDMNWDQLKDYSVFTHFDPKAYIVLNPHFHEKKYQDFFHKLSELYREYLERPDMRELILSYWNPRSETMAFRS
ncbi:MAG: hypothetical protein A3F89_03580 [Deltaproteobacteria bacterium RIFCSPLOWO2_12_FULL_50_11]|nr:MAG: hypothetical protein A3F89_03580 [Deltaproteobacteria bacterium RIFCSPLOWO2_12_FULL_50_11]